MVNRFVVSVILVPDGPRKINVRSDSHADPALARRVSSK